MRHAAVGGFSRRAGVAAALAAGAGALVGRGRAAWAQAQSGCARPSVVPGADPLANGEALRAAIDAAAPGAALDLPAGFYDADLRIDRDLSLRTCGGGMAVLRNATAANALEIAGAPTVSLERIGISSSTPDESIAGGIWAHGDGEAGPAITLVDCLLTGNRDSGLASELGAVVTVAGATRIVGNRTVRDGGGVFLLGGTVILEDDALVTLNVAAPGADSAGRGGGVFVKGGGSLVVRGRAAVTANVAEALPGPDGAPGEGGGVAVENAPEDRVTIDLSAAAPGAVSGNVAEAAEGGGEGVGGIAILDPGSPALELAGVDAERVSGNHPRECTPGVC